jgi:hypothetical protein
MGFAESEFALERSGQIGVKKRPLDGTVLPAAVDFDLHGAAVQMQF